MIMATDDMKANDNDDNMYSYISHALIYEFVHGCLFLGRINDVLINYKIIQAFTNRI